MLDIIAVESDAAGVRYPGGKNGSGVYQRIITMMPPHAVYVEPFLGGGAIARLKRPAALNIAMDVHRPAVENFRKLLASRPEELGSVLGLCGGVAGASALEAPRRPSRIPKWWVGERDCMEFLETAPLADSDDGVLFYCDPPYVLSTLSTRGRYDRMLSDLEHQRFLRWAIATRCMVMISGYWSELYAQHLRGWRLVKFQAMTRGGLAEECVWCNFPQPVALHDYRYLGEGFRERERINRKKETWTRRLRAMPLLERQAILCAIADTALDGDVSGPL